MHSLLAQPHHDGSEAYVPETPAELGDDVTVLLRVPKPSVPDAVAVRYVRDGEPQVARARDRSRDRRRRLVAGDVPVWQRRDPLSLAPVGRRLRLRMGQRAWVCRRSTSLTRTTSSCLPATAVARLAPRVGRLPGLPRSLRVIRSAVTPPDWAIPRGWDELPTGRGPETPLEWFGGDLRGIEERLDHLTSLGVNVLYLTPVFPAQSTHRYDATTFDSVDPLLGGEDAFASLVRAAHSKGIRRARRPDDEPRGLGARVVRRRTAATGARSARSSSSTTPTSTGTPAGSECRPSRSSTTKARSCASGCTWVRRRSCAAGSSRRTTSTAGVSTSRT